MQETIYLRVSKNKVEGMTKNLPYINRGEVIVKVNIQVADSAFQPPTLEQDLKVQDWQQGIDLQDVEFNQAIITPEEAEVIRNRRLEKMKEILENQGYIIQREGEDNE